MKEYNQMAVDEWKLLSSIIARLEDTEYKIRSWLFALITGLAIVMYSDKTELHWIMFLIIGIILVWIFILMDLVHRMPKRYAIKRAGDIEEILKKGKEYDGPRISSLADPERTGKWEEFLRMWDNTPYRHILLLLSFLVAGYAKMKDLCGKKLCMYLLAVIVIYFLLTYVFRILRKYSQQKKEKNISGAQS
jgi:uncharacterized membrane protein